MGAVVVVKLDVQTSQVVLPNDLPSSSGWAVIGRCRLAPIPWHGCRGRGPLPPQWWSPITDLGEELADSLDAEQEQSAPVRH
jgi:hypothetical protein